MANECCATQANIMLLACSGGSNVGQLANQAAVELTREGFGRMYCLAGIGGRLSGFVQSARDVANMVVVDGCEVGCAAAVFKENAIPLRNHVVVTDLGIAKNRNLELRRDDIDDVKDAVRAMGALPDPRRLDPRPAMTGGCCGGD